MNTARTTTMRSLTRWSAPAAMALTVAVGSPALASAEPVAPAPAESIVPYCEMLPMIMIYPPPPTTIMCHTVFGDFMFMLPPGTTWPFQTSGRSVDAGQM